ncbi:hypothetical protein HJG60_011339 [Phyllostomus discolor]|uniref:Uncharacterized protein n=1 Tax=Phyllostomus discolor TaxID=89673 RepID=A0A834A7I3_9CHIR|nr:hypothetical protein HJG60_011339 [Phyllostomus discolor]
MSLLKGLSILFIFSKNQLLDSLILRIVLLVSMSFNSALILVISFLLLALGCLCCSLSSCRHRVRLFVWNVSNLYRWACIAMNFPLRTAMAVCHKFWVVVSSFSFVSRNLLTSSLISFLTRSLFNSMLFNLHDFECFWFFSLGLVSSFSPLWSEKMLGMISVFLKFLRLVLCPIMWSVFENVPCTFEKNVYLASFGWRALYISVKSISSRVIFNATISLLIFCLGDLSIFDSGVLKSPTIIVLLSISFLKSSKIFFMYFGAPMLGAYIFTIFMSS